MCVLIAFSFGGALDCDFIYFDDNLYIFENPYIRNGLTWEGVRWAFTADLLSQSRNADYWQPVTFLSRMIDIQLYGLTAAGHHLTNLVLHVLNALLFFHLLNRMTGAFWASAFAAALFALHPLRVEAVVWVTSRKDVLSTCIGLLALEAYVSYARRPTFLRKAVTGLTLGIGLMSKPMLVTLPLLMLLLDLWPLNRRDLSWREAFQEKWLFFLMCAATGAVALGLGQPAAFDAIPARLKLLNVPIAYARYLLAWLWPVGLAGVHTFPFDLLETWRVLGSIVVLVGFSIFAFRRFPASPHLSVGWLWFLLTLLPAVGLDSGGFADRFSYVPLMGLSILVSWSAAKYLEKNPSRRAAAAISASLILAAMSVAAHAQVRHWKNSEVFFARALAVTKGNWIAECGFGNALLQRGETRDAIRHYEASIRLQPRDALAHLNIGIAYEILGKLAEAETHYAQAIWLSPDIPDAHNNLGVLMEKRGDISRALTHYRHAAMANPFYVEAHNNLGSVLADLGHLEEAIERFKVALKIAPNHVQVRRNLAAAERRMASVKKPEPGPEVK